MRQQPTDVGVHVFYGGLWNLHSVNAPLLLRDWGPSEKRYESTGIRMVVDADRAARPLQGGSWFNSAQHALEARRNELFPLHRDGNLGFRLTVSTDGDRVYRGGSWRRAADLARAAFRRRLFPDFRLDYLGFRLTVDNSPENTMTTKEMARA